MSGIYGLSFSNVYMRPEFMTSMSCDSVLHVWRGFEQSLIDDAVDPLRTCIRANGGHFEHTLWLSICFLCTWWTLSFTTCLIQRVIFKECIIKVWNLMFSFLLGSVSTLFRWGGHFCYVCVKRFFMLTSYKLQQCKNYKNRSRFSRVMVYSVQVRVIQYVYNGTTLHNRRYRVVFGDRFWWLCIL